MYGIAIALSAVIFSSRLFYAIGLGLFIDELPVLLIYGTNNFHWKEYDSWQSRLGVLLCILLVCIFRKYIVWF